jgi:tRNA pseudouridine38-40 synthase
MTDDATPLQRYRLRIEYDGTHFSGWQLQTNGRNVQGELETALRGVFGRTLRVHGAGRTDAGVHASGQVAHVDAPRRYEPGVLLRALNAVLPRDITVHAMEETAPDFHARFQASSRAYVYTVEHGRTSLHRERRWILHAAIDHARVGAAVALLPGTYDFRSFSKHAPGPVHHLCHVFTATWETDGRTSRLRIRANRFLHGMVRAIVGGLMLVGRGKLSVEDVASMLAQPDHARLPMLAPPHGLVLEDVRYDAAERAVVNAAWASLRDGADGSEMNE